MSNICENCGLACFTVDDHFCPHCQADLDDPAIWDDTADGAEAQASHRECMEYARHYGPDDDG